MSKTVKPTIVTTTRQLEEQILKTDGVVVIIRAPLKTKFVSTKAYPTGRALNATHTVKHLHERIRSVIGDQVEFEIVNGDGVYVRRTTGKMLKLRASYLV